MRPNIRVRTTSAVTTAALAARIAGTSWIFASHPSHLCIHPVKSRNNSVINKKNTQAAINLIFRNTIAQN